MNVKTSLRKSECRDNLLKEVIFPRGWTRLHRLSLVDKREKYIHVAEKSKDIAGERGALETLTAPLPYGGKLLSNSSRAFKHLNFPGQTTPPVQDDDSTQYYIKVNMRASFPLWIKYWDPRLVDGKVVPPLRKENKPRAERAVHILFWLFHDVFEYSSHDTIKSELMSTTVLMSCRVSFPLASMFLGGLYR